MRSRNLARLLLLLTVALPLGLAGCKNKGASVTPDAPEARAQDTAPPARAQRERPSEDVDQDAWGKTGQFGQDDPDAADIGSVPADGRLATIFFAYDSYDLTPTALATLRENAEVLKAYPQMALVIEGHCDERGTIEYNLALGEKRASSVRDYMSSLGVDRSRIRIITYGEERPADPGHGEGAWSRNRRAEFQTER